MTELISVVTRSRWAFLKKISLDWGLDAGTEKWEILNCRCSHSLCYCSQLESIYMHLAFYRFSRHHVQSKHLTLHHNIYPAPHLNTSKLCISGMDFITEMSHLSLSWIWADTGSRLSIRPSPRPQPVPVFLTVFGCGMRDIGPPAGLLRFLIK